MADSHLWAPNKRSDVQFPWRNEVVGSSVCFDFKQDEAFIQQLVQERPQEFVDL